MKTVKVRGAELEANGKLIAYSLDSIEDIELFNGEYLLRFSFAKDILRKLMGQTLTVIDASIVDSRQNKAAKDIIRNSYNEELCFLSDMSFDQEVIQRNIGDMDGSEALSVEDVLGVK